MNPLQRRSEHSAVLAAVIASIVWIIAIAWQRMRGLTPAPFVWYDLAVVYSVCMLPLSLQVSEIWLRQVLFSPRILSLLSWSTLAAIPWMMSLTEVQSRLTRFTGDTDWTMRSGLALMVTVVTLVAVRSSVSYRANVEPAGPQGARSGRGRRLSLVFGLMCATLLPEAYAQSRRQERETELANHVRQQRWASAADIARDLLILAPAARVNDVPLREELARIESHLDRLKTAVAVPLPARATDDARLIRARLLAMLNRNGEAEAILRPLTERSPPFSPACNLLGTICELDNRWQEAHAWYSRAEATHQSSPETDEDRSDLFVALRGRANAAWKLGSNREAEAAYQQALDVARSADSHFLADVHFLLAQFYENTQQATLAQTHAREAVRLDPKRYRDRANELINKLVVYHFGCLPVYSRQRQTESAAAP